MNGHHPIRRSHLALGAALVLFSLSPGLAHAQLATHFNEQIGRALGPYDLQPGVPKTKTMAVGQVGKHVPFVVRGTQYNVKASVTGVSGSTAVRARVEMLDNGGSVVSTGQATAQASTGAEANLLVPVIDNGPAFATRMRITYEVTGAQPASLANVLIDRISVSQPVADFDFGD
jgi:hypothetical protein